MFLSEQMEAAERIDYAKFIERHGRDLGLTPLGIQYALSVVSSPPSREPQNSTGRNQIVDFASVKMGQTMALESVNPEAAYAEFNEHAAECLGWWPQPAPIRPTVTCKGGIKRPEWITLDFLVLRKEGFFLVECKLWDDALKISGNRPGYFVLDQGSDRWTIPEIAEELKSYGIKALVITERDLPTKLIRNLSVLDGVRGVGYSTQEALPRIVEILRSEKQGLSLATLLAATGAGFVKNDLFVAILRKDIHVLLSDCLLVDDKTTRIFYRLLDAESYRLLNFETKEVKATPLPAHVGSELTWNGTQYSICSISREIVYFRPEQGSPIPIPKDMFSRLLDAGEVALLEETIFSKAHQTEALEHHRNAISSEKLSLACRKQQFIQFKATHPNAVPQDFGLPPVSGRTSKRWGDAARDSLDRYGTELWGLLGEPRPGYPRDVLPTEMIEEIRLVANELYFANPPHSIYYCWREFRRRRESRGLRYCTKNPFKRQVLKMMNERDATRSREGSGRAYSLGGNEKVGENWINKPDSPLKYAQLDTKYNDLEFVDEETGESLGIGSLTLLTLPFYGGVPIGRSILLEPPSYRSATSALRDAYERYGELPSFIGLDGGPEYNNTEFDKLLGVFGIGKNKNPRSDPRDKSDAESRFRSSDAEFIHQLAGNTVPRSHGRAMSKEFDPRRTAVWTLPAFQDEVDHYLFKMLWDAHSAKLGTTPRQAFERDLLKAPDRKDKYILPEGSAEIAFFPDVKGLERQVVPGRGVWVEGYYYWSEEMRKPGIERTDVRVRYDPYNLYTVYVAIRGKWEPSVARFAPELRNVTERYRHLQVQIRRRLSKDHGKKRDTGHGRAMAERAVGIRDQEKLLKEQRRARAQRCTNGTKESPPARLPKRSDLPKMDFTVLNGGAA